MKIYIPKHIRNIEVVEKMCELIEAYSNSSYSDNTLDSFNNYYYYLNTDPVVKFLHFCILRSEWEENQDPDNSQNYDSAISYIARLFYSVKGTYQVFDYMEKYLGLHITDIVYTVKILSFTIPEITLSDVDEKVWYDSLLDFLNTLLYFDTLRIKIELINLHISNTLRNYIGANSVTYKEYTTVRYEN